MPSCFFLQHRAPFLEGCHPAFQPDRKLTFLAVLFFDFHQLQRPSFQPDRERLPWSGREGVYLGSWLQMAATEQFLSWFQALQEVSAHSDGARFTSAFIFLISAGQTENLINCMKPK